jgi:lysylphosphatidylglycerol synthetase-like protein (DUF2156 family)
MSGRGIDGSIVVRVGCGFAAMVVLCLQLNLRRQATHVDASPRQPWIRAALIVGAAYFVIGRVFAVPSANLRLWRLAAWMLSGLAYATHIWYELFKLRNSSRSTGLHVALAVAIGAIGLALAGMIHSLSTGSPLRPAWLLALVLWPAITAIPAFLGALVAAAVLSRLQQRAGAE